MMQILVCPVVVPFGNGRLSDSLAAFAVSYGLNRRQDSPDFRPTTTRLLAVSSKLDLSRLAAPFSCPCALFAGALGLGLAGFARLGRRERFLICFSGVPMVGVLCLALTRRVQPNWPAAFYAAGVVLVVGWALGKVPSFRPLRDGQRSLRIALAVGMLFTLFTYLAPFGWGLQGSKLDPVVRLRGWRRLGEEMGARFDQMPRPDDTFMLFVTDRAAASESAFYMPQQPRVYLWNGTGRVTSQYDIWGGPKEHEGSDAMIVAVTKDPLPNPVRASFRNVQSEGQVRVHIGNGRHHTYWVWRGERYLGPDNAAQVADGQNRLMR